MTTARKVTEKTKSKSNRAFVAAIDFGTTYSGYAYATAGDFQLDIPTVKVNPTWIGGSSLLSHKAPTVLLLGPQQEFVAFGYEAEDRFLSLAEDDEHHDYYYFRRFKMVLYNQKHLTRTTELEAVDGKKLNAITVFSHCIKFLYNHFLECLKKSFTDATESDVHWVLTVPAIWNDGAKQFMREAAEKAGIERGALTIALEPEAASLFCMHQPLQTMTKEGDSAPTVSPFKAGNKYMVVDIGGGTVDITVHEVVGQRKLKELIHANGGAWGGTRVDDAYLKFLEQLFGEDVMREFKEKFMEDVIAMMRGFETKKRNITSFKHDKETLDISPNLTDVYVSKTQSSIETVIQKSKDRYSGSVTYTKAKRFKVASDILQSWFKDSCDNTVEKMRKLFKNERCQSVNTILLVGGFAESLMIQNAVQKAFPDKRMLVPNDPSLAVVKGAVLFGHDPLTITERVAKATYGIRVYKSFDPEIHPISKREVVDTNVKCKDIFSIHVRKGESLKVDEPQEEQTYTPLEADQTSLQFDVFSSTEENPKYTDEQGCSYIGQLEVDMPGYGKDRTVHISMTYGGAEVTVTGSVKDGNKQKQDSTRHAKFDFLHAPLS